MKIRYFFGFALLYLVCVGAYAFYITADYYTLENTLLVPFKLTLPLALWVCLPAVLLLCIALFFMSCAALVRKFKQMSLQRDFEKVFAQIHEQMLGNPVRERVFSSDSMKTLAQVLKRFELLPNTKTQAANYEKIDSVFESFKEIEDGKNNAKIKLNPSHPLYKVNVRNSIQEDSQKAFEVLKQDLSGVTFGAQFYTDYARVENQKVYDMAWNAILKHGKTAQKALALPQNHLTFASIMQLLQACVKGSLDVQKEKVLEACKSVALSEREYLMLAIESCKNINQENINVLLGIFESLSKDVEASVFAYFYILLEVGKTNEAMDLKRQYPKNDFLPVSAFSALKDKGYPLLVFFDPLLYRAQKPQDTQSLTAMPHDYSVQ